MKDPSLEYNHFDKILRGYAAKHGKQESTLDHLLDAMGHIIMSSKQESSC